MAGNEDCSYNAYIDQLKKEIDELSRALKVSEKTNEEIKHALADCQNRNSFLEGQVSAYELCITKGGSHCK